MNVLVVEDDPSTARLLAAVLLRADHDATICGSAEEARDQLSADGFDAWPLCIVDLALPGKDGIWLCHWIRQQPGGDAPYLLVGTGSDHSESLAPAFDAGADDYVEKPYEPRILGLRFAVAAERLAARAEQVRLSAALEREQHLVSAVFDTAAACIVALDAQGRIAKANDTTIEVTGLAESNLISKRFEDVFCDGRGCDGRGRDESISANLKALSDNKGQSAVSHFETQISAADGSPRDLAWVCRRSQSGDPDADPLLVCVGSDITDRRRLESQLVFLAERDPLTHLFNRSQLDPAMQSALDSTREGRPGALICLDLDDFKIVNDTAGHAAGDTMLQSVAHLIARHVRPSDTVIRQGGDEFVIVLPETGIEQAEAVAERIRSAVQHLDFTISDRIFRVTASIGLVSLTPRMSLEEALAQADAACYSSKRGGRNLVTIGNGIKCGDNSDDQAWHDRLIDAIAHDAIDLWLQPIVSLRTGEAEFQEVLLRLPGADGACRPSQFLPSARRYNLLPELDRCVVRNALDLLQFDPKLNLSVNLSGRSASDPRLPDFLTTSLRRTGIDPSRVIFEITESELISDLPHAIERLSKLRAQGFRFALDDFGRGYSSFSYLRELPVEIVKIDGSYTRSIADDPASVAFVRAITELSHAIGMTCVAEHVEDEDAAEVLRSLDVDLAQGFHLGEPRSYLTHSPAAHHSIPKSSDVILPK